MSLLVLRIGRVVDVVVEEVVDEDDVVEVDDEVEVIAVDVVCVSFSGGCMQQENNKVPRTNKVRIRVFILLNHWNPGNKTLIYFLKHNNNVCQLRMRCFR